MVEKGRKKNRSMRIGFSTAGSNLLQRNTTAKKEVVEKSIIKIGEGEKQGKRDHSTQQMRKWRREDVDKDL